MRRRDFIAVLVGSAAALPFVVRAQQTRPAKLGVLLVEKREPFSRVFWEGLRELGYIDGQNMQIEYRSAEGKLDRLATLAAELVDLKVDIIVASETPAVQAAKRATTEIPIVMAPSGDPVGTGLIGSLSRPGGNVTGLSAATAELAGKSLELIREMLPGARRVAALADPANAFTKSFLAQIHGSAKAAGFEIQDVMLGGTQDLEPIYHENSCFYIFSRETNQKIKNRLGSNPLMFSIDRLEAADIDDMEDFYWAEFLMLRRLGKI